MMKTSLPFFVLFRSKNKSFQMVEIHFNFFLFKINGCGVSYVGKNATTFTKMHIKMRFLHNCLNSIIIVSNINLCCCCCCFTFCLL